tara:strand:- start:209988 stop:211463 length:1476 start_codon:yes stop_codon:yes gene_type:complete
MAVVLAFICSLILSPLIGWLLRIHVRATVSSALIVFALLSACSVGPVVERGLDSAQTSKPDNADRTKAESGIKLEACQPSSRDQQKKGQGGAASEDHISTSEKVGDLTFQAGNDARLKIDGPGTYGAMFADMEKAKQHIHLETFILEDGKVGEDLAERLIAIRRRGVEIRILIDAFGSMDLPDEYVERLQQHGIELRKFHPIDPSEDPRIWRSNNRDHRKLLIIDGKIAYTGGLNFSAVYSEGSFSVQSTSGSVDPDTDSAWRDTQVRIVGPAVSQFQHYFLAMWNKDISPEEPLQGETYFPVIDAQGNIAVAVVASSGGDSDEFNVYSLVVSAIEQARRRVWITQAYFAPNPEFIDRFTAAARRGIDLRLLLPGVSDSSLVVQASRSSYQALLESGVRIYERSGSVLHAKTIVVDGVWSSIGSTNFDYRSFVHNYELNAVLVSCHFGAAMEKLFEVDLTQSKEITLEAWENRPFSQRFEEWIGDMFREWL